MKFLLTSAGVSNRSIEAALVGLLGKPVAEASALFIATAIYPFPGGAAKAWEAISGKGKAPLAELGWRSLGVLELTALPTIQAESWVPTVKETDALLVWGGDVLYLCHWMRKSGLLDLFASLDEMVYVGVSAGSIAVTPYNCDAESNLQFVPEGSEMGQAAEGALSLVDFAVRVHVDNVDFPDSTLAATEAWAAGIPAPTYAIDDQTAIAVSDGSVRVVSEGHWKRFAPSA